MWLPLLCQRRMPEASHRVAKSGNTLQPADGVPRRGPLLGKNTCLLFLCQQTRHAQGARPAPGPPACRLRPSQPLLLGGAILRDARRQRAAAGRPVQPAVGAAEAGAAAKAGAAPRP